MLGDVARHQFGQRSPLTERHMNRLFQNIMARTIGGRVIAHRLDKALQAQTGLFNEIKHFIDAIGPILLMQKQVIKPGIAAMNMIADKRIALEPVGPGQGIEQRLAEIEAARPAGLGIEAFHHFLHVIDALATQFPINHQPHATIGFERIRKRAQPRIGIRQMMQHPATVNVIERPVFGCQINERTGDKGHVLFKIAALDAGFGDLAGTFGQVDIDDIGLGLAVAGLLGQHDKRIARPTAGDQNFDLAAFGLCGRITPAKNEMHHFVPVARRSGDKSFILILGIAGRIGICLVLVACLFRRLHSIGTFFVVGHYRVFQQRSDWDGNILYQRIN